MVVFDREAMTNKQVVLDDCQRESYAQLTNSQGDISFRISEAVKSISLPIYGAETKLSCTDIFVKVTDAVARGIVGPNQCGRASALPSPGQITVFARQPSWLEILKAKLAGS
jgi:hypothetical protein